MSQDMQPGINKILISQAGEWFVLANLLKQGIHAQGSPKNWPGYDILATSPSGSRARRIEVKSTSSSPTTYAASLPRKTADYFVLVASLRARTASAAASLEHLGAVSTPRAFVIPGRSLTKVMRGGSLRILKSQETRYENRWGLINVPRERNATQKKAMLREAARLFVACHFARCGFTTVLGSRISEPNQLLVGVDRSLGDWRATSYLSWKDRHSFWKGRPVLLPIDVLPYRDVLRLTSCEQMSRRGDIDPTLCDGLLAFLDVHAACPLQSLVVFDRQYLRRMRKRRRTWNLGDLREEYAALSLPWAA